ncbi:MAG: formylglycine-generating enzyme family protein, partial [Candidatus Sumerlaeota bacterium]|nr:formylglycine-generating enzyme family protein [Candidatus Sumerlaeota bacterium]
RTSKDQSATPAANSAAGGRRANPVRFIPPVTSSSVAALGLVPTSATAGQSYEENFGGGMTMKMIWIKGGMFQMGGNDGGPDQKPVHEVTLDGYWLGETEVTQALYEKIMGKYPSNCYGLDRPVESVSWNDALEFCQILTAAARKTYTLPTEAQWEYACRAGTQTLYSWGDNSDDGLNYCNGYDQKGLRAHTVSSPAFNYDDGYTETAPVKGFRPNAWGLYDMHGNVSEWCFDWYGEDCYRQTKRDNPEGPLNGTARVLRGGSCYSDPLSCRSAARNKSKPTDRDSNYLGFRVCVITRTNN